MALTEKAIYKESMYLKDTCAQAEETGVDIGTSETPVLGPMEVKGLKRKTLLYVNSGSQTHTVKIYGSLKFAMPTTLTDSSWEQIGTDITVTAGGNSGFIDLEGEYRWLIVTAVAGSSDTGAGNCYFAGRNQ